MRKVRIKSMSLIIYELGGRVYRLSSTCNRCLGNININCFFSNKPAIDRELFRECKRTASKVFDSAIQPLGFISIGNTDSEWVLNIHVYDICSRAMKMEEVNYTKNHIIKGGVWLVTVGLELLICYVEMKLMVRVRNPIYL